MMQQDDLHILNGLLVDGSGDAARKADLAVRDGCIRAIAAPGQLPPGATREVIDAAGCIVTPGFVDIHTHYDGQVTWEQRLLPSSMHGVTTVVMGNCGVGFAPCRVEHRALLVRLMEGVEDIPQPVLDCGLPWAWQSFPEYLDFLAQRSFDADICAYLPHAALRVYVMGERAARREAASAGDIAQMAQLLEEALLAGAIGFSTSRTFFHRASDGSLGPSFDAAETELLALAAVMRRLQIGVLQMISDFDDARASFALLHRLAQCAQRPVSFSLLEGENGPLTLRWREVLDWCSAARAEGLLIRAQVLGRAIGVMLGHELTLNPFYRCPSYLQLAALPWAEKLAQLQDATCRQAILAEAMLPDSAQALGRLVRNFEHMFVLGEPPDYEQDFSASIAARARRAGQDVLAYAYDLLLHEAGRNTLYVTLSNYVHGNLESAREMMLHESSLLGLGDGGAHCGTICDAAYPSFMLTHWVQQRTRGARLPLEAVVKALSADNAQAVGLFDRGCLREGMKADLNVINLAQLRLHGPAVHYDLPGGGRRLLQQAQGYLATVLDGRITYRDGIASGALPGRLLRGAQPLK